MSSVERVPLGAIESKAATGESFSLARDSTRKPVLVLNFGNCSIEDSLPEYFEEEDIINIRTRVAEVPEAELHKKLSNVDVCILLSRENMPCSFYTAYTTFKKLCAQLDLKIVSIEVNKWCEDFSDCIEDTINGVKNVYGKHDKNPIIAELKDQLANGAISILSQYGTELNEPLKRAAFRDLITPYVAIDNAKPEIIVGYCQSYQKKLIMFQYKFERLIETVNAFKDDFKKLPVTDVEKLASSQWKNINKRNMDAWDQLLANINQHYPQQLTQQATGVAAEDSDMGVIAADSDMVDALAAGPDPAVVTTVVGVPPNTMTALDAMKECGEEPTEISSTPFWTRQSPQTAENTVTQLWSIQPAQTTENTVTQPRTGLTK